MRAYYSLVLVNFFLARTWLVEWISCCVLVGFNSWHGESNTLKSIFSVMDGLAFVSSARCFCYLGFSLRPSSLLTLAGKASGIAAFLKFFVGRPWALWFVVCHSIFGLGLRQCVYLVGWGLRGGCRLCWLCIYYCGVLSNSELLFEITFTVVLISLLLQGSIGASRWLGWCKTRSAPGRAPTTRFSLSCMLMSNALRFGIGMNFWFRQEGRVFLPHQLYGMMPANRLYTQAWFPHRSRSEPTNRGNTDTYWQSGDKWMLRILRMWWRCAIFSHKTFFILI